jgi:hypothetical protein
VADNARWWGLAAVILKVVVVYKGGCGVVSFCSVWVWADLLDCLALPATNYICAGARVLGNGTAQVVGNGSCLGSILIICCQAYNCGELHIPWLPSQVRAVILSLMHDISHVFAQFGLFSQRHQPNIGFSYNICSPSPAYPTACPAPPELRTPCFGRCSWHWC